MMDFLRKRKQGRNRQQAPGPIKAGNTFLRHPRLAGFLRNVKGTAAVEFAFIAPMLLFTILFLMMLGYIMVLSQSLSYATQKAARQIATGQVQAAQLTQAQFISNVVCGYLISTFNCNDVIVNIQPVSTTDVNYPNEYYNFVNASLTALILPPLSNSQTSYCPGDAGGYVYLQILYPIPVFVSVFVNAMGVSLYQGKQVFLSAGTATFLNEPFVAPVSSC
jgi:Flp pilus assembly protein TadG